VLRRLALPAALGRPQEATDVVTVTVLEVRDGGLEVQAGEDGATGFIKRADLGRDRDEQRPTASRLARSSMRWSSASTVRRSRTSRSRLAARRRKAGCREQYGSSDSGASLGDILGEALKAKDRLNAK
jgi:small subunit ribosomal protein S1